MQDILKKSAEDQDAMSNRVAALLAGTSLTTTAGTSVRRRDDIEEVNFSYTIYGLQEMYPKLSVLKISYFWPNSSTHVS